MVRVLLLGVVVMGCGAVLLQGAPVPGGSCAATDAAECMTASSVGVCDAGKWLEQSCEGRCSNAQTPRCALQAPAVGSACPVSQEEVGYCQGNSIVRCSKGTWLKCACGGCSQGGDGLLHCSQAPGTKWMCE